MKFGHTDIISCIKLCDFLDSYIIKANNKYNSDISSSNNISDNSNDNTSKNIKNNNISVDESVNISPSKLSKLENYNTLNLISERKNQDLTNIKKPFKIMENHFRFYIPVIISTEISMMKMRELVQLFRNELLIFDLDKKNGIVFNLPDIIQCGMFGICGVANDQEDLVKIMESTINLMKNKILKKESNYNKSLNSVPNITRDNLKIDTITLSDLLGKIMHYVKSLKK